MIVRIAAGVAACLAAMCVGIPAAADPGDSTGELQALFDGAQPGSTVTLDHKVYPHGGVVTINVPNVKINGNGATLQATNDATSSLHITADGVTVSNLNLTAPIGGQRYSAPDQDKIYVRANGVTLNDITIAGSAATGVFLNNVNGFSLNRVTVRDSRADGIHMTLGSSNGQVNNPLIERSGDDGVAVVSYSERFLGFATAPCRNIVINSPTVTSTTYGQGISALGGENISYRNINISSTWGAGVFIGSIGAPFFTQATSGVEVTGGTVTGANTNGGMGAIAVFGEQPGVPASNVTIANLRVVDTPESAQRTIAVHTKDGGTIAGLALRNLVIRQNGALPVVESDGPRDSYSMSGVTLNGSPYEAP
ncbi:MAG: hypothetical protein QOH60_4329 [Mycobacterium sp.]|jgi:hypothetical protein|nr:hypothetical protein [Mycobacterium sp.]